MVTDSTRPADTLGLRLERFAAQLIAARSPAFGWLPAMQQLLNHLAELPGPTAGRFDRVEAGATSIEFRDRMPAPPTAIADGDAPGADGRLPSDVHAQLRRVLGLDTAAMRVHDDRAADQLARRHRADAVTVGRDVYFRQDRLRPRDPQGFGLVAHEATHVAEFLAPGAAWRRLTGGAQQEEERLAEANERRASHDVSGHAPATVATPRRAVPPPPGRLTAAAVSHRDGARAASPPSAPAPAPATAPHPMRAAEDRATEPSPALDVEALQRGLLEDLKRQLLAEFERGA